MIHRYAELSPDDLTELLSQGAPVIVPWGALEWHGAHLPLGLDGIVAEAFAARLAERVGGVLLPAIWLPITTLPHRLSLQVETSTFRAILQDLLSGLHDAGATRIAIVTGHYAQGHLSECYESALGAMEDMPGLRVWAATPLEPLLDDRLLDHAGRVEAAQLLSLRPDLVWLDRLPATISAKKDAVLGDDPRSATAEEGATLLDQAETAWATWLDADSESLRAHYKSRFDALEPYVEKFFKGSWEDAIQAWWAQKE